MFSTTVFKQSLRNNYKIWIVVTIATSLFLVMMFTAFSLRGSQIQQSGSQTMTVLYFLSESFYGMIGLILPMIYIIFVGNKLVAAEVDSGILSYTLNTPITRTKVILTKAIYLICSVIAMMLIITLVGLIMNSSLAANMDIKTFLLLNLGLTLYSLAISGIVFFSSSFFNKASNAMALGAGVPVLFFVLSIVASLSDSFEFVKYFSLNTLFDTANIMTGTDYVIPFIAMFIIGVGAYIVSIIYFKKKDLPI